MNARPLVCAVVATGALIGAAAALEVSRSAKVEETPEAVWQKIGGETYRTLTPGDGSTIRERLIERTNSSYTYEIIESPLPVQSYRATLSVSAEGEGTRIDCKGSFDAKDAPDTDAEFVIDGIYEAGLEEIANAHGN